MAYKYFPCFRARQQEIDVLKTFEFSDLMIPIVEIIKEKDRVNNTEDGEVIYSDLIRDIQSQKVLIDLPIYLELSVSTSKEVRKFVLSTIRDLDKRIEFYSKFSDQSDKAVPVISSLNPHSDEADTMEKQFTQLSGQFPIIAFRLFINRFDESLLELYKLNLRVGDLIIYDLDTVDITSPLVKKHKKDINEKFPNNYKIVIRSAINTDIQNIKLDHGSIVPEANNSLLELYNTAMYRFDAFGDYAGVKKDDITSGGTISPGFILFNPEDNLYYGFKGRMKSLSEFETTIAPDALNTDFVKGWIASTSPYYTGNLGLNKLEKIRDKTEPGRSQAKFKWISMMHYLHVIKVLIA
jgi:hypothetical protein